MKSQWIKALKDIFTYRREVELYKNLGSGDYGIRTVMRSRVANVEGWRSYGDGRVSITIPRDQLKVLLRDIEHFYEVGYLQTENNNA